MTDGFSILAVDDERQPLAQLTSILTPQGYDVRSADCGRLALESVIARPPHLILLDVRMPDMHGFEICRQLKACENTRNIPVMFITAAQETEERVEGFKLGAVDFIVKPFRPEELLARVRTHVELGQLRADLEEQVVRQTAELRIANERLQEELTQRRLAEKALRESEERFRNMADTAPVGIWVTNPDGAASFYNKRALAFAGRSMDQLIGNRWTDIIHPSDLESTRVVYDSAVAARRSFRIECRIRRADGQYRWVLNSGIPRHVDRVYAGHIGTVIDTTDLKRSQEQIIASQKLESLGVLAAGIAHDFNNMLGAIFAESDVALLESVPNSPVRGNIERIKAVAVRASEIVKLLMAYAGGNVEAMEQVDLSRLAEETLSLLRGTIADKAVLHIDLARDLSPVLANAAQLRQVVLNLIVNASEALQGKYGHISVVTARTSIPRPLISEAPAGLRQGEYVRLEVADTGCGMTPEVQALVFDPFYTTKFLGRGLGLAVVQGIVRSHGGGINIVSKPGAGSKFEVFLPCTSPASVKSPQLLKEQEPCLPSGTALLVAD